MATDEHEQMINRMAVASMMRDDYENDPPDVSEWVRALEGCAALYELAAKHLQADPPNFREAANCINPALQTGIDLRQQVVMAYALSGAATDDFMNHVRDTLAQENQQ